MKRSQKLYFKLFPIVFLLSSFANIAAYAEQSDYSGDKNTGAGLGVILGEPTGFTGKVWLQPHQAVDAGLAFSFDNYVLLYSDYLFHFPGLFGSSTDFLRQLQPYAGVGGELIISEDSSRGSTTYYSSSGSSVGFAFRVPLGAEWLVPTAPIGIFAELVPGVGIVPGTYGFLQGGVGARWYF
jgi:hypothetical protein